MYIKEDTQHDILFVIVLAIVLIFITGMAETNGTNGIDASIVPIITE